MKSQNSDSVAMGHIWLAMVLFAIMVFRLLGQLDGAPEFYYGLGNDSAMRLVMIRDLLGGQGWFDMSQNRLGPSRNFEIHWSRLVDGPVAALILIAERFTDRQGAEMFSYTVWPLTLLWLMIWLTVTIAFRVGGAIMALIAGLTSTLTLALNATFQPGSADHHNLQLVLLLAAVLGIIGRGNRFLAVGGGLAMAYSICIGVETLPHLAVIGVALGFMWIWGGLAERAGAIAFSAGLGIGLPLLFLMSAPASAYRGGFCDALSIDLAVPVTLGAAAIALSAYAVSRAPLAVRAGVLGACGVAIGIATFLFIPACLSNPYAGLDPYLQDRWIAMVFEANGLGDILAGAISRLYLGYYILISAALLLSVGFAVSDRQNRATWLLFVALIGTSLAMSVYQVRGTLSATVLSLFPIAAVIARLRDNWRSSGRKLSAVAALVLLILCLPTSWWFGEAMVSKLRNAMGDPANTVARAEVQEPLDQENCLSAETLAILAALPKGMISANSNLGAQLLLHTGHRVLAAPYHRNEAGMIAQLQISLAPSPQEAHRQLVRSGVAYVVTCDQDPEIGLLNKRGYSGFGLALQRGEIPDFLVAVATPDRSRMKIYRLR